MHETTYAFNVFASFGNVDLFKKMLKKYKFGFGTTSETRFGVEWVLFTIGRDIPYQVSTTPKYTESEKIISTHHTHHHTHHHKHHTKHEQQLDEPAELYH